MGLPSKTHPKMAGVLRRGWRERVTRLSNRVVGNCSPPLKEPRNYDLQEDDRPRPGETADPGDRCRSHCAGLPTRRDGHH